MVKSILKSFGLSKSQSNPREEIEDIISEEGQKEEAFDAHEKKMNYMDALIGDKNILKSLTEKEIKDIFVPEKHLGASQIIINNVDKHVKVNAKKLS